MGREVDVRTFREALAAIGERHQVGLVVSDAGGVVLFTTARARRVLGGTGVAVLPADLQRFVEGIAGGTKEEGTTRMKLPGSPHAVSVRATRLAGTPRHVLLTLEEEAPRPSLAKGLVEQFGLSARSVQLVQLASRGLTNREIADRLRLSESTVKTYMHGLFREVGVRNRAELVALADRMCDQPREG